MHLPRYRTGIFLMVAAAVCTAMVLSMAAAGRAAARCLDSNEPGVQAALIVDGGCRVWNDSGESELRPIHGAPFEAGVAGLIGLLVVGAAAMVVTVRPSRRSATAVTK